MHQDVSVPRNCRLCFLLVLVITFVSSVRAGNESQFRTERIGDPQSVGASEIKNATFRKFSSRYLVDQGMYQLNGFSPRGKRSKKLDRPPNSVEEAVEMLEDMGHELQYLIADVDSKKGTCEVLEGQRVHDPAPVASLFKLWVLGAVVETVKEGTITWDQDIFITDELRSLPTGIVQDDPAGSSRTVRELAELMIRISDNTATDLLMALVGRAATLQAQVTYGRHNPNLNRPFLNTKEWLILKLDGAKGDGLPGPLGKEYIASSKMERRLMLDRLRNAVISFDLDPSVWDGGPIAIDVLEWFASPMNICKTMVRLHKDEEAARMLSLNHGVPDEEGIWSYVGFKGGNEPGVLGLSWYLVPALDTGVQHQAVIGFMWDKDEKIDENRAYLLFGALRDLYWKESTSSPTKHPTSYPTKISPTFDPQTSELVSLMTEQINHPKPNEKQPKLTPTNAQVSFAEVSIVIKPTTKSTSPPTKHPASYPTTTSPAFDPETSELVSLMTQQINHPKPNEKQSTLTPTNANAQVSFAEVSVVVKPTTKTRRPTTKPTRAPKTSNSKPSPKPTNNPTPRPTRYRARPGFGLFNEFPD